MRRWECIIDLIKKNGYKRIVEVGVCKGQTAMPVIEACELEHYTMVDPAIDDSLGLRDFLKGRHYCNILPVKSADAVNLYPDRFFDLAFIDALHKEEDVDEDIHLWTPKVRPGGIVCGHDYDNRRFPGVEIAVHRFYGKGNIETVPVKACKIWVYRIPEENQ